MTENKKIEIENEAETTIQKPKQSRFKKWSLNLLAVMIGFVIIGGVLGALDILAQRELQKTGEALPKLFLYRGWKKQSTTLAVLDPFLGHRRNIETAFPNLVEDHLPYIVADYFKIFLTQSTISKFDEHSKMQEVSITSELLAKLEHPFIVCLGGSTTDHFLQIHQNEIALPDATGSWPEELSRIMENKKIKGTVFCGGTGGYRTSQDVTKLLRDVLEIEPDVVISYGGVNDLAYRPNNYPIYNRRHYQYLVKESKRKELPRSFLFPNLAIYIHTHTHTHIESLPKGVYFGVKSDMNVAEYMIRNWKIMQAICDLHGIKFYGVLQPCVGSTEVTRGDSKFVSERWRGRVFDEQKWDCSLEQLIGGYEYVKTKIPEYKFMQDFSAIFDKEDLETIYPFKEDFCHVSQEGNRIVAENMFKMLFGDEVNKVDDTKNDSAK
jgi:hypothetical protein